MGNEAVKHATIGENAKGSMQQRRKKHATIGKNAKGSMN